MIKLLQNFTHRNMEVPTYLLKYPPICGTTVYSSLYYLFLKRQFGIDVFFWFCILHSFESQRYKEMSQQKTHFKFSGSCSSSEQNEFIENGTASSQEKQNSIAERILENRPEIIRNLIRKYIQDKCGELFMSISLQVGEFGNGQNILKTIKIISIL